MTFVGWHSSCSIPRHSHLRAQSPSENSLRLYARSRWPKFPFALLTTHAKYYLFHAPPLNGGTLSPTIAAVPALLRQFLHQY